MANSYLQIAVFCILCLITLLIIMLRRRCFNAVRCVALGILLVSACFMMYAGIKDLSGVRSASVETAGDRSVDKYIAYSYAGAGDYEHALRILADCGSASPSNEEFLMKARIMDAGRRRCSGQ